MEFVIEQESSPINPLAPDGQRGPTVFGVPSIQIAFDVPMRVDMEQMRRVMERSASRPGREAMSSGDVLRAVAEVLDGRVPVLPEDEPQSPEESSVPSFNNPQWVDSELVREAMYDGRLCMAEGYYGDPVFSVRNVIDGDPFYLWFFYNESWSHVYGPFADEQHARRGLQEYTARLLDEENERPQKQVPDERPPARARRRSIEL